jgi:hypothetical protein
MGEEEVKIEETELKEGKVKEEENPFEPPEEKTEEEKTAEEVAAKVAAEKEKEIAAKEPKEEDEVTSLRQLARQQRNELAELRAQNEEHKKALEKAELLPKEDEEEVKKANEIITSRAGQLSTLLEAMKVSPKFEDVEEVVSQPHFDDLVEMMAEYIVSQQGGSLPTVVRSIVSEIWSLPNPYRYMYEKIKEFHPDYIKSIEGGEGKKGEEKDKGKKKEELVAPKVPGSIQDIPGGGGVVKGWTSAMIDALEEDELSKVPPDVYDLYLKNQLS